MKKETLETLFPTIAERLFPGQDFRQEAVRLHILEGMTYYAAEKQAGHPPNTLGRHVKKFKAEIDYISQIISQV